MSLFTNIHRIASRVIPTQSIQWRRAVGKETDQYGVSKLKYTDWQTIKRAHSEPGFARSAGQRSPGQDLYDDFGLSFTRRTFTVWCDDKGVNAIIGKEGTDQIKIGDVVCNVVRVEDWIEFDGWKRILVQEDKGND